MLIVTYLFVFQPVYIPTAEEEASYADFLNRAILGAGNHAAYADDFEDAGQPAMDMMRDRRVIGGAPRAESNFQLRVRKRDPAENFQLRVRKALLDRLRTRPQVRSAAEDNFQLRVSFLTVALS